MHSVRDVMESKSVAIFGASRDPQKPGATLIKTLQDTGFKGRVAGINPQGGQVYGTTLYRSLDEVPFPPDLAVMLIPPKHVAEAIVQCARKGVKGVVITSEGFAETGSPGRQYQEDVRALLRATGVRGFGPNTLGLVNTVTGLTTSYGADAPMIRPGGIGLVTQSGVFVGGLLKYMSSYKSLRISKGVGIGNKVDVDESDALDYLCQDEQTRVVGMYLEDLRDGRRFLEAARKTVALKPVLLLKGGRTPQGARASASHTGSLAVDDAVLDGALRQAGVLRIDAFDEMMAALIGFHCMPLPKGNRIAVMTYSGAQGILTVDAATGAGLGLARFSEATRRRISRVVPTPSKAANPVDIYPDMLLHGFEETASEILHALFEDEGVHGIIIIYFAGFGSASLLPLARLVDQLRTKPVFFSLLGVREELQTAQAMLDDHLIPFCLFPETAVRVLAHMWHYAASRNGHVP